MVGRALFYSMDANTAKSVKRSFTAPEGAWTLEITVDKEGLVWEIDETNNIWNRSVSGSSSGFGAATVLLGGGGLLEAQLPGLLAGLGERAAVACHGLGVEGWLLGSEAQQPWIARLRGECAHGMGGHVCTQKSGACARCACSGGTMPRGLASMPQYFQV